MRTDYFQGTQQLLACYTITERTMISNFIVKLISLLILNLHQWRKAHKRVYKAMLLK